MATGIGRNGVAWAATRVVAASLVLLLACVSSGCTTNAKRGDEAVDAAAPSLAPKSFAGRPEHAVTLAEAEELLRKLFGSDRPAAEELPGVEICDLTVLHDAVPFSRKLYPCLRDALASCHEAIAARAEIDLSSQDWNFRVVWVRPRKDRCDLIRITDTREDRGAHTRALWAGRCALVEGMSSFHPSPGPENYTDCSGSVALARCPATQTEPSCAERKQAGLTRGCCWRE